MVIESGPWKRELEREARDLERRLQQFAVSKRPSATVIDYKVERFAFLFAFIARKLLDSNKLSNEVEHISVALLANRRRLHRRKRHPDEHPIMEKYTFAHPRRINVSIRRLCEILIHSKEFLIVEYPERTFELSFNSDRTEMELYRITLKSLLTLARKVAKDDIVYMRLVRDRKTDELVAVEKSNKHPAKRKGG